MKHTVVIMLLLGVSCSLLAQPKAPTLSGNVQAEWLDIETPGDAKAGRDMKILRALDFFDEDGRRWHVPAESIINGASIPSVLWSAMGSPFTGRYRSASVIHDHYCRTGGMDPIDNKRRSWREVHKMFFSAMLAGGVSRARAEVMYRAVQACGPRWDDSGRDLKHVCRPADVRGLREELKGLVPGSL